MTVIKEVIELKKRPAAVIISGDLALNSGEAGDYATLGEFLQPLRAAQMPIHLALGNHDHHERFWDALLEEKTVTRPVVERQVAMIRSQRANWFVLDSLDKTLSTPGVLGETQLAWLAKSLDANADKPALVVIHHNPDVEGKVAGLVETKELFEIMRPHKQVKAYIMATRIAGISGRIRTGSSHQLAASRVSFRQGAAQWLGVGEFAKKRNATGIARPRLQTEHGRKIDLKWRT